MPNRDTKIKDLLMQNYSNILSNFKNSKKNIEIINTKNIKIKDFSKKRDKYLQIFIVLTPSIQKNIKLKLIQYITKIKNQSSGKYSITFVNLGENNISKFNTMILSKEFNASYLFFSGFTLKEKLNITKTLAKENSVILTDFSTEKHHKYNVPKAHNIKFKKRATHKTAVKI